MGLSLHQFSYACEIEKDEEGFLLATFPDFPEAATDAQDIPTLKEEAADCLEEAVAGRIAHGEEIPPPSTPTGRDFLWIPVPAVTAAKAALYLAVRESGLSNSELARRLDCDEKEIRRMLDPKHRTKLPRIEAALKALGKRLTLGLENVA